MSVPVEITGLSHRYGELGVLDAIDLTMDAGSVTAIIGPTGCGKSTLLRILAGLVVPSAGTARVGGVSAVGAPGLAGYMPQTDTLLPWRRAFENATLGARIAGAAPNGSAEALFARFGLAGFERSWPHELSGGMRQRVALLRTVLTGKPVLLLDEPFGALDAITRQDLQGWLSGVLDDQRRTTILVTHDIDDALRLADTVVAFSARPGRIVDRLEVPAPRPRSAARLTKPDFAMLKRRVLEALRGD